MKKTLRIVIFLCLLISLLYGAVMAESEILTMNAGKETSGISKGVTFVELLRGVSHVKCTVSGTKATLTWGADPGGHQDGYAIHLTKRTASEPGSLPFGWYLPASASPDGYNYIPTKLLAKTSATSCTINLKEKGTYYLEVDSYAKSPKTYLSYNGVIIKVVVGGTSLGKPTGVKASQPASKRVKLTWKAGKNAKSYIIYRATGSGSFKKVGTTKKLTYTDKKVKNGTAYKYKIVAKNGSKTASSSVVKAYPMAKTAFTLAKSFQDSISLEWKKVKGAKGYRLYEKGPNDTSFHLFDTEPYDNVCLMVEADGTYQYYLVPVVGSFRGLKSKTVSVKVSYFGPSDDNPVVYRAVVFGQVYPEWDLDSRLPGCEYDMIAMQKMLSNLSSTEYSYIKTVKDATAAQMASEINAVFAMADNNDVTLLYYSGLGHGGSDNPGALVGVDHNLLSASKLRSILNQYQGNKVIILDSCFSGAMIGKDAGQASMKSLVKQNNAAFIHAFRLSDKGDQDLAAGGYYVISACTGSQLSAGFKTFSLFTLGFTEGCGWDEYNSARISLKADGNGDNQVTLAEAYTYSRDFVDRFEEQYNPISIANGNDPIVMDVQVYPTNCSMVFFAR